MIHGIDTSFLVAAEVVSHQNHAGSRSQLERYIKAKDQFALVPQVLAEFIHVVSDPKRFAAPLTTAQAVDRSKAWWNAAEIIQIFPSPESTMLFFAWLEEYNPGRKRLLDTMLASTWRAEGITSILTLNRDDFSLFGEFSFPK